MNSVKIILKKKSNVITVRIGLKPPQFFSRQKLFFGSRLSLSVQPQHEGPVFPPFWFPRFPQELFIEGASYDKDILGGLLFRGVATE